MHDSTCHCNGKLCGVHMGVKILIIIGGLNWGLIGLGMLMGKSMDAWNVVHMILGSMPTLEGLVYLLVGVAAGVKIFGGRCTKCMEGCATCEADHMDRKM